MKNKTSSKSAIDKLLSISGVKHAVGLFDDYCQIFAFDDSIEMAAGGELGEEAQELAINPSVDNFNAFINLNDVQEYFSAQADVWSEKLASYAGRKIADIWNLSDESVSLLSWWIIMRSLPSAETNYTLIFNGKLIATDKPLTKIEDEKSIIQLHNELKKDHLYLDVTSLSYKELKNSYKFIHSYRANFGLLKEDMKEGSPLHVDVEKALNAFHLKSGKLSSKQIAYKLGFKVYLKDNPSGSYPLLHKYLKVGAELHSKLDVFESFLWEIHNQIVTLETEL